MTAVAKDTEKGFKRELPSGLELVWREQDFIYHRNTGTETVTERKT